MGHTDRNQDKIVGALRKVGASVAITSGLGRGFPDLVVGYRTRNILIEVKDGTAPPSKRRLTPDQQEWHDAWRGQVCVVESPEEALRAIGAVRP